MMAVDDWNTNPDFNNTIEGEDISEGCLPEGLNDWGRKICAAIKVFRNSAYCKDKNVTTAASGGALPGAPAEGDWFLEY